MYKWLLLIPLFLCLHAAPVYSDVIELENGKRIEGEITRKNKNWIELKVSDKGPKGYYLLEDIQTINGQPPGVDAPKKKSSLLSLFSSRNTAQAEPVQKEVILHFKKGNSIKGKLIRKRTYYLVIKPDGQSLAKEILWDALSSIEEPLEKSSPNNPTNDQVPVSVETTIDQVADIEVREFKYNKVAPVLKDKERKALRDSYGLTEKEEEVMYQDQLKQKAKKDNFFNALGRGNPQTDFEIGSEISLIDYQEPGLMRERGAMYGVYSVFTYRLHPKEKRKTNLGVWDKIERYSMLRLDGKFSRGEVDYDSQGTGSQDGLRDYMLESRIVYGYQLPLKDQIIITPYFGLGLRYLNDDLRGDSSTGNWGYERESKYYYMPLGLETNIGWKNNWLVGVTVEYDYFIDGTQKSHLEDGGLRAQAQDGTLYAYDTLINDQDQGYGLKGSMKIMKKMTYADLYIEPFVRYWNIQQSDLQQLTSNYGTVLWFQDSGHTLPVTGVEPHNTSTEYGVKIGARF